MIRYPSTNGLPSPRHHVHRRSGMPGTLDHRACLRLRYSATTPRRQAPATVPSDRSVTRRSSSPPMPATSGGSALDEPVMIPTGRPLDIATEGPGHLCVAVDDRGATGLGYTRDSASGRPGRQPRHTRPGPSNRAECDSAAGDQRLDRHRRRCLLPGSSTDGVRMPAGSSWCGSRTTMGSSVRRTASGSRRRRPANRWSDAPEIGIGLGRLQSVSCVDPCEVSTRRPSSGTPPPSTRLTPQRSARSCLTDRRQTREVRRRPPTRRAKQAIPRRIVDAARRCGWSSPGLEVPIDPSNRT